MSLVNSSDPGKERLKSLYIAENYFGQEFESYIVLHWDIETPF